MKKNRIISFIIILLVYIVSFVVGFITYNKLSMSLWMNLLLADVVSTVVVFIFSCIFKNASVYDPYWSVQPIIIIWCYVIANNFTIVNILFALVITGWGLRLTLNWAYTFKNLESQDWRYTMLKEKTKNFYPIINFIGIHLVPTLVVYLCVLPAVYVVTQNGDLNAFVIIALVISTGAFIMQGVADIQMHKFRKRKQTGFIRDGLWKYSRHPNYFGEILMWWGIGLASIFSIKTNVFLLIGTVLNTLLFLFVSIPMADNRNKKRGDIKQLKTETRMLLPIKNKNLNNY